jgi:hypothetical protein
MKKTSNPKHTYETAKLQNRKFSSHNQKLRMLTKSRGKPALTLIIYLDTPQNPINLTELSIMHGHVGYYSTRKYF